MVHLSRKELSDKTHEELEQQLSDLLFAQDSRTAMRHTLRTLLSAPERVMLAKRVSAIGLLAEGYSTYAVGDLLGMSPTTLSRMQSTLRSSRKFNHICKTLKNRKGRKVFTDTLSSLLVYGRASQMLKKQVYSDIERWKSGM